MQWGPDSDAKLFMHMLKIHNIKPDYQALALAMGEDVTAKAISHRIAKLKSISEEKTQNPTATPTKRTRHPAATVAKSSTSDPPTTDLTPTKKPPRKNAVTTPTATGNKRTATGGEAKTASPSGTKRGYGNFSKDEDEGGEVMPREKKVKTEDEGEGEGAGVMVAV